MTGRAHAADRREVEARAAVVLWHQSYKTGGHDL
jgi:hypothetical protein